MTVNRLYTTGKPDVGHIPTIQDSINVVRTKKNVIQKQMRVLAKALRRSDTIDQDKLTKFQDLNEQLRKVKIMEAEFVYIRNLL